MEQRKVLETKWVVMLQVLDNGPFDTYVRKNGVRGASTFIVEEAHDYGSREGALEAAIQIRLETQNRARAQAAKVETFVELLPIVEHFDRLVSRS